MRNIILIQISKIDYNNKIKSTSKNKKRQANRHVKYTE
nr:MAG TPA: hypothetical protein [Caudoviricetes sp.]